MLPSEDTRSAPAYRAVILTALPVEFQAVREHLTGLREEEHPEGSLYERGRFSSGKGTWEVLLVEVGTGNQRATLETARALEYFKPHVALFVGVAGGLKDVSLGDVVFAPKVYGYESGKVGTGFEPRPDVGESSYALEQRARAEARKDQWRSRIPGAAPVRSPRALAGAIAAGEKVVAETRSEVFRLLRTQYGDALAVEMEGRGFLVATRAHRRVHALVIRGISDCIDGKEEADADGSQHLASRHASAFAFEVLAGFIPPEALCAPPGPRAGDNGPVWTVPHPRNPNFTGREALLQELRAHFLSGTPRPMPLALHGLGGVGKTQLAVEYAGRHTHDTPGYTHVLWLRADEPSVLASSYAALTEVLGLPERAATEQRPKLEAVRQWLQRHTGWLLVFDNAEQPGALAPYLPPAHKGHVLITSRNPAWGQLARPHAVNVLALDEAVEFLRRRTGQEDEAAASHLAIALGGLPLALVQAAAYIEQTGKSLTDYLRLFEQRRRELLDRPGAPPDHPHTVAATWSLSFEQVHHQAPAGAALLSLCAFLAPGPIPIDLFKAGVSALPEPLASAASDELQLDEAIGALLRYSLVQIHHQHLVFHRLVQAVMRDRLAEEAGGWAASALRLMHGFFVFEEHDLRTWQLCGFLFPHAMEAATHAWEHEVGVEQLPDVLFHLGQFWHETAEYALAREMLELGLTVIRSAPRQVFTVEGSIHQRLGCIAMLVGEQEQALEHFEHARAFIQTMPASPIRQVSEALILRDLAVLFLNHGELSKAREFATRALEECEPHLDSNHPFLGLLWDSRGAVLLHDARYEQARECFERALAITEASLGPHHPRVALLTNSLASALEELGEYEEAKSRFERALETIEPIYGDHHPHVAALLRNLGSIHMRWGALPEARACCERALRISEARFGPEHVEVALSHNDLGRVLHGLQELEAARTCLERSISIIEQLRGEEDEKLATPLDNLGRVLEDLGLLEQARASFERSLAINERTYGPEHPLVANVLNNLGVLLQRMGDPNGARLRLDRALAIDERTYGSSHPEVAVDLSNLAEFLIAQGEEDRARELLERAVSIYEAQGALARSDLFLRLLTLGLLHFQRLDWEAARGCFERARPLHEQLAPERALSFKFQVLLGSTLRHLQEYPAAISCLEQARALQPETSDNPGMYQQLLFDLGSAHLGVGNMEQAQVLLDEAKRLMEAAGDTSALGPMLLEQIRLARLKGELKAALGLIEQAWALREGDGLERPDLILNEWGLVLEAMGDPRGARPRLEEALKLSEEIRGPDSHTVAAVARSLGRVLLMLGELPAALQHFDRALSIMERLHGPTSLEVAEGLRERALLLSVAERHAEAEADARRAVSIYSTNQPPDGQQLAMALQVLANIHLRAGTPREARSVFERALRLLETELGPEDAHLAPLLERLAILHQQQRDYRLAAHTLERALKCIPSTLHQKQLTLLQQIGILHKVSGNLDGARSCFTRAVELIKTIPDPDPAAFATSHLNVSNVLRLLGEFAPALQHVERVLAIPRIETVLPPELFVQGVILRGEIFSELKRWQDARASLEQGLRRSASAPLQPERLCTLHTNLGNVLTELRDFKLALLHADKATKLAMKVHGPEHPEYALTLANFGTTLARAGKPRDAWKKYKRALSALPPGHPLAQEIRQRMEQLQR